MKKTLAEYINNLKNQLYTIENWELSEAVEQIAETYKAMLQYLTKGVEDPNAEKMQGQLWTQTLSLQQRVLRLKRLKDSPSSKYSTMQREVQNLDINSLLTRLELNDDAEREEEDIVKLFKWTLTSDQWKTADYEVMMQLLTSSDVSDKAKAVMIAATGLATLDFLDEKKLMLLLDAYLIDNKEISMRALVCLILALRKEQDKLNMYPEIVSRLEIFSGDEGFVQDSYNILIQLQMSSLTDKVASKIREDIMPSIVKGSTTLKKQMGMLEINEKMTENGENPEWLKANAEDDSKAEEKMREMTDMQLNGEDVYMATFAMLKGYRFFNETAHWFYPFTTDDPALTNMKELMGSENGRFIRALLNNSPFCNSDKYSLCLLTNSLGMGGFGSIAQQMEAQMADMDEEEKSAILDEKTNRQHKRSYYSRSFIFDLYRFHYIYGYRNEFYNPFLDAQQNLFSPLQIASLRNLSDNSSLLLDHAEFLMRKEYYAMALQEFIVYSKTNEATAELYQKIGFCQQKLENWEAAKQNYIMADSIKPSSKWTLSHLGKVCKMLADYKTAMDCYSQLCDMDEENIHYLLRLAEAQAKQKLLKEAISTLYKANYLSPNSDKVRRQLAICLMQNKEEEKALTFMDAAIDKGVAYMVMGKNAEAYNNLKIAFSETKDKKVFAQQLEQAAQPYYDVAMLKTLETELLYDSVITEL